MRYFFRALLVIGFVLAVTAGLRYVIYGAVIVLDLAIAFVIFFAVEVLSELYKLNDALSESDED